MSPASMAFWGLLSVLGILVCGLFAGLETGVYSLNRVRLHLLSQKGDDQARILASMVSRPAPLLATLLIGTNVATNLATSAMGVIFDAHELPQWQVIVGVVLIETPLLFIFAETLPKDLFAAHADHLVYPFAKPIFWLQKLLTFMGILPLITFISSVLMKGLGSRSDPIPFHPRRLVTSLVKEGLGRGLLSDEQTAIVDRVISLGGRTVRHEMVPWSTVVCVGQNDEPGRLWELARKTTHSRFPVVADRGRVVGIVNLIDALVLGRGGCPPIPQLMRAPCEIEPGLRIQAALERLQAKHEVLAIVADPGGAPLGLVTIKDLVEPITGELANW